MMSPATAPMAPLPVAAQPSAASSPAPRAAPTPAASRLRRRSAAMHASHVGIGIRALSVKPRKIAKYQRRCLTGYSTKLWVADPHSQQREGNRSRVSCNVSHSLFRMLPLHPHLYSDLEEHRAERARLDAEPAQD